MMRWIVGSSLKYRFLVVAAAAAMMYFGVERLHQMPMDVFPEFAPPSVDVQTICIGLSPTEVESLVTVPMEQAFAGLPGLDLMRSKSVEQLSAITLIFKDGTDLLQARQAVAERVAVITPTIPTWAAPPVMLPPMSATSRVMKIGISSDKLSGIDLSMIAYWTIRQRLMRVPGVANVPIWGERLQMLNVEIVPELMKKHGVELETVMETTADALDVGLLHFSEGHIIGKGGWMETANQRLPIVHVNPILTKTDKVTPDILANVPVTTKTGKQVLLKDVARVVVDHQPMIGDAIINDGPGLLLIVERFPWANTLELTRNVEAALKSLQAGLPDVKIDSTIFRPATFIDLALHNLTLALVLGCGLVMVILIAFLYNWRPALISCVAIPLSLMAAVLVFYLRGSSINTMILAGLVIAVGVVVDDAIIDIENVVRRLREQRNDGGTKSIGRIILEASLEVRSAIVYATMIDAMTLLPVFFMEGLSGAFFRPLAVSYALAVMASMVVALTVTPAMAFLLLHNAPLEHREPPLVRWLHRYYDKVLMPIIRAPRLVYGVVALVTVAGIVVWPMLGQSLFPAFKQRDFLIHWIISPGSSWPEIQRMVTQGSKEIRTIPGVRNFGSHIGQALVMDEVIGIYAAENWISIDPKVDYDETLKKLNATVDAYPGLYHDVQTYLNERIEEVLGGSPEPINVRVFGDDLHLLRETADKVRENLAGIKGLADLHVELVREVPQVAVKVDLARAEQYGVKPGDVRRAAATLMAGEEVGDVHLTSRTYDVNVWSVPEARTSLNDIRELPIDTPRHGVVQLQQVADVEIEPTPNVVEHENHKRHLDVRANVRGRDIGSVIKDVDERLKKMTFPLGFYPDLAGEYQEQQATQNHLLLYSALALFGTFLLLLTSFGSTRLATLSFLTLPSALVGGVLAAYFTGGVIQLGSLVGLLTIFGIAARNKIMLINHYQHLENVEGEKFGPELVLRGARERLSPILMTALATGLAIVPLVISGNIPGHEIEHPMAIVILGGLITSTLLNLFVVPSLYLRFGKGWRRSAASTPSTPATV
jgi:CzcA family heavy metal efflux pump